MIHQYSINIGFCDSASKLSEESNLQLENYAAADNMDLLLIIKEYEDYYYVKFGKNPIFFHKISDGKMGGPLPRINNGKGKSKSRISSNQERKKGPQTPRINNIAGKKIDISPLKSKVIKIITKRQMKQMINSHSMLIKKIYY